MHHRRARSTNSTNPKPEHADKDPRLTVQIATLFFGVLGFLFSVVVTVVHLFEDHRTPVIIPAPGASASPPLIEKLPAAISAPPERGRNASPTARPTTSSPPTRQESSSPSPSSSTLVNEPRSDGPIKRSHSMCPAASLMSARSRPGRGPRSMEPSHQFGDECSADEKQKPRSPIRTNPYSPAYNFPMPGSPEAINYVEEIRALRRQSSVYVDSRQRHCLNPSEHPKGTKPL